LGGFLSQIFGSAHDDVPLSERDILQVGPRNFWDGDLPDGYESRVTNMQTYLDDGRPPDVSGLQWNDQYIDWQSDDAFTQAIEAIRSNTFERIEQDPDLQALLAKESWTREDRVAWERGVSEIINDEHAQIQGLNRYRNNSDKEAYPDVERRASRLNDLAVDIENDTLTIEHDCESNSIVEGVVLQLVDNAFLPDSAPEGDYKEGANYFYTVGRSNFTAGVNGGVHAWVTSSATMNVIDGAAVSLPYRENVDENMTFEDFIRGGMIINSDTSIYSGLHHSFDDFTRIRIERGDISLDQIFESMPSRGQISDETYENAPPEAQVLIDIKSEIEALERQRGTSCEVPDIEGRIAIYRSLFERALDDLVDDAGIYTAMDFSRAVVLEDDPRDTRYAGFQSSDFRDMVNDLGDKVYEMHPEFTEEQMVDYLFDIYVGALPDIDGRSFANGSSDYDEFLGIMARRVFEEEHPSIDYDTARAAFNTSIPNNMIQAMYRGEITREQVENDPEASIALIYTETHQAIAKEHPIPGTARAHGQTAERVAEFFEEYDAFKAEQACSSEDLPSMPFSGFVMR